MTRFSKRSGVLKTLKNLTSASTLDKVIAKFAFSPPQPSYRFSSKNCGPRCNSSYNKQQIQQHLVLNKVSNIEDIISQKGYRTRAGMVETLNHGGIPFVYLVPKKLKLNQCDKIILYSHGASSDIGTSIKDGFKLVDALSLQMRCSWGIILWDYPGYGLATEKKPSEAGIQDGILSIHNYLISRGVSSEHIVAIGRSMGSVPTSFIASCWETHAIAAICLISPIASAYHAYTELPPTDKNEDPVGVLSNIKLFKQNGCPYPVFIFHGEDDDFIPFGHAQALLDILQSEQPRNVTEKASSLAMDALEHRRSHDIPYDNRLWPSISYTVSENGEPLYCNSFCTDSSLDECLYKERSKLYSVPGVGHNDIMKNDYLYKTLGESLENIC